MDRHKPPPELTGENYAYWKARTRMHIKAQGEHIWRSVLTGWTHPTKAGATPGDPRVLKPEIEWDDVEMRIAGYNNKALDIIYSLMHESQFTLVTGCNSAKAAWDILETTYEGTDSVKQSKLQLVQTDFEDLRMHDDEKIVQFNERVQELANRAAVLGEPFSQSKLVKKILRSLPVRFRMKVTAIQENAGWDNQSVAQLMGNLTTYEMEYLTDHNKKQKSVAFTAEGLDSPVDIDETGDDEIALLTKQFAQFLKQKRNAQGGKVQNQRGSKSNTGGQNSKSSSSRSSQSREKTGNKGIRCFECEGFGHVQAECPTYLRRKKSMSALTWSDDEPETETAGSDSEEMTGNFVAFTAITSVDPDGHENAESEDGEYNSAEDFELPAPSFELAYKKLYSKWEILIKENCKLSSQVGILENAKNVYQLRVADRDVLLKASSDREEKLKQELETLKKRIKMMDNTSTLDQILDAGRQSTTKHGLGFTGGQNKGKTTFVRASGPDTDIPESSSG